MSGGIAYVLDEKGTFDRRVNPQMVGSGPVEEQAEITILRGMIERHLAHTGSKRAKQVLEHWGESVANFVKVIPKDYQRMLACINRAHEQGLTGEEAIMVAFEENARDLARVGGN
jgi:glutamate synthase (ferredoxin)